MPALVRCSTSTQALQSAFLALLPRIELHGRIHFSALKCPVARQEAMAEMVALCWLWYLRLAERGRDANQFPSMLATYAARAVRSGRRLCGQDSSRDVLSPVAQWRRGFVVSHLPDYSTLLGNPLDEALQDNTKTEVPEQVSFRIDFPSWQKTLSHRNRQIANALMVGERSCDVAQRFGMSASRVAQLRYAFHEDWQAFHGEK